MNEVDKIEHLTLWMKDVWSYFCATNKSQNGKFPIIAKLNGTPVLPSTGERRDFNWSHVTLTRQCVDGVGWCLFGSWNDNCRIPFGCRLKICSQRINLATEFTEQANTTPNRPAPCTVTADRLIWLMMRISSYPCDLIMRWEWFMWQKFCQLNKELEQCVST